MILVFKTSVRIWKDVRMLRPFLNNLIGQSGWNFDLEDRDKILRIDSSAVSPEAVVELLRSEGFDCEELLD